MRNLLLVSLVILLSSCGGGKVVPDWKKDSVSLIEKYERAELKGNNTLAERYFEQALDATGSAAKIEETARLHLIRCATRQASLTFETCSGYLEYAKLGTSTDDDTYHRLISGQWEKLDARKLPSQYRDFATNRDPAKNLAILQKIDDPFSRLIAISIVVMQKQADDGILNLAVETASEQGWRKPLLVYLKLQENRARLKGDSAAMERIHARIKLVEESL